MAESWTTETYRLTEPMFLKILEHPFLKELTAGTLPKETLIYYFEQNLHYIDAVVRCRAVATAKSTSEEVRDFFLGPIPVFVEELKHQRKMVEALGGRSDAPLSPTCHGYTRHILTLAWSREPVEYFGAFLPCPWTYDLIGRALKGRLSKPEHLEWWDFYMSKDHNDMCDRYRHMVDKLALDLPPHRREQMREDFKTSLRYEYRFWSMAYNLEQWEI